MKKMSSVKNQTRNGIFVPTIATKVRITGSALSNLILVNIKGLKGRQHANFASKKKKYRIGTIARSGGSTSGLKRHLQSHHKKVYEELLGLKKVTPTQSTNLVPFLERKKAPSALGLEDIRRQFKLAATSWAITECASLNQFTRPTFRNILSQTSTEEEFATKLRD